MKVRTMLAAAAANVAALFWQYPNPGGGAPSADQTTVGPITGQTITFRYAVDGTYDPTDAGTEYALVIFLHGQSSDEDAGMTNVWPEVQTANTDFAGNPATGMQKVVFVTLRALDSWYTNNAAADAGFGTPGAYPIETMIVDELIPHLQQHFRLNGVIMLIGFSMGGFGAGKLALKHRDIFRAASLWQPPRTDATVFNWSVSAAAEFVSIWDSSTAKIDENSWVQICDVQRAAIIAEAYPMYCLRGSNDPGNAAWGNAITKVQGYGITLTVATTTAAHNLGQAASLGFAGLAIWLQQRIAP